MALFFVVLLGLISIISTLLLVVLSGKMIPYTDASGQVLPGSLAEKSRAFSATRTATRRAMAL